MDSCGKRASRSTSAAHAASTSRPSVWVFCSKRSKAWFAPSAASSSGMACLRGTEVCGLPHQFGDRPGNGLEARKGFAAQHRVGKLDVEVVFQGQHDVHRRQGGEPGEI